MNLKELSDFLDGIDYPMTTNWQSILCFVGWLCILGGFAAVCLTFCYIFH